jgi:hypothetical protein
MTWEPEAHLAEYGAAEMLQAYKDATREVRRTYMASVRDVGETAGEVAGADTVEPWVTTAVRAMLRQNRIAATPEQEHRWELAYRLEFFTVTGTRADVLQGDKRKEAMRGKCVPLRMNPEIKSDGRFKCRLLVRGDLEPRDWCERTDAPVVKPSSARMLLALSTQGDGDDVIGIADVSGAFCQGEEYQAGERPRVVKLVPFKGAEPIVMQLRGSLYGQRDASLRWFLTIEQYLESQGFKSGSNDRCVFYHPLTKLIVAVHVDDILARGKQDVMDTFFANIRERFDMKETDT